MLTKETTGRFLSILNSDGNFHETVTKDTKGAVLREYETSDGKKGEKWEQVYTKAEGHIVNMSFRDGDFGEQVMITVNDGTDEFTIAQGVSTSFGEDILKKLPSLDLSKSVTFAPYSFNDDKGRSVKGVTLYQDGEKVKNAFWDGEKTTLGFPEPEGDTKNYDKDDWKIHFLKVRKFVVNYAKDNVLPNFPLPAPEPKQSVKRESFTADVNAEVDELDPGSIPF
jgi:hypothetical protein